MSMPPCRAAEDQGKMDFRTAAWQVATDMMSLGIRFVDARMSAPTQA
jgi:hypothetical protein